MTGKHLFLFGGSPPFTEKLGRKFSKLTRKQKGKVAILFLEREGWLAYMPKYTKELEKHGLKDFIYVALTPNPSKDMLEQLSTCTGIIIGGGDTERYRDFIVNTIVGARIQEMYEQGVPVAGFSAGALISPVHCVIPPVDNTRGEHLFLHGLGLVLDCVISVHFSKWGEEENLRKAVLKTNVSIGYGIDDDAGVYFENGKLTETEGKKIYCFGR
ncbi:Type 1 glutamine amidotransferase-like domain-containing protein [Oceanobacillus bengalensis]|uniref:Peptidase S51 dipeptidase E n=1 Tax=Oceanobacillus bengalensis TaxID=1435466 RepID=A0A494Z6B4_9BACI|nr:Type 1 glutamine amidotransferase-like domain-containing protein [Oceanobacillus bengalensis]RKQ17537.1 peptidase S51 dipeptidase E [Oceanobacillus bengalensis]